MRSKIRRPLQKWRMAYVLQPIEQLALTKGDLQRCIKTLILTSSVDEVGSQMIRGNIYVDRRSVLCFQSESNVNPLHLHDCMMTAIFIITSNKKTLKLFYLRHLAFP